MRAPGCGRIGSQDLIAMGRPHTGTSHVKLSELTSGGPSIQSTTTSPDHRVGLPLPPTTTDNARLRHHKCRILPISLCSRIVRRAVGPTISRSLGFQAPPTSFGVVRSAPKRSLADSSDESVPTEIHRSFRREPVVVHARRSPSNGRRGARGRGWFRNPRVRSEAEPAAIRGGRPSRPPPPPMPGFQWDKRGTPANIASRLH